MGTPQKPEPVKLFVGMISARAELLDEAGRMLAEEFGPMDGRSADIPFDFTDYYAPTMGGGLMRRLVSFANLMDPGRLAEVKLATNRIEQAIARARTTDVKRPVNLDSGYLSPAKVVLATVKDYSHRIYLGQGIYAEVTLRHHKGRYEPWEWTFPDYRTEAYLEFFAATRKRLMDQKRKEDDSVDDLA